jgi:hypothetical protein
MLAAAVATTAALAGCPLFGPSFPTNQRVDALPVAPDSNAIVRSIGLDDGFHADFGAGLWEGRPIGIPYTVVNRKTRRSRVRFDYAGESDRVRYPIPRGVKIEGGGDRHALLVDRSRCKLYELFALRRAGAGWHAGSGATWKMRRPKIRPRGWTSADAAGLPIFPGLVRYDEAVTRGAIDHAVRFTCPRTRRAFVAPARHYASSDTSSALPPMGMRVRLKASYDVSSHPAEVQVILRAMKKYGMILADNGSGWYVTGAPDTRWDDDRLGALKRVPSGAFEVVRMGEVTR